MGDKITQINNFEVGNPVVVSINIRGNEYNGKYYNSINGWKIANSIGQVNNTEQNPSREQTADLMKKLKENEAFPVDFWNYNVNQITGYYIKSNRNEQNKKTIKKYAKPPQGL